MADHWWILKGKWWNGKLALMPETESLRYEKEMWHLFLYKMIFALAWHSKISQTKFSVRPNYLRLYFSGFNSSQQWISNIYETIELVDFSGNTIANKKTCCFNLCDFSVAISTHYVVLHGGPLKSPFNLILLFQRQARMSVYKKEKMAQVALDTGRNRMAFWNTTKRSPASKVIESMNGLQHTVQSTIDKWQ